MTEEKSVSQYQAQTPALLPDAAIMERVIAEGDLSKLTPGQRVEYMVALCRSLGLNPMTRPFQYIVLNGKLTLYATRDATDQLRKIHGVDISISSRERIEDVYVVTARATMRGGRTDESTGAVSIANLRGDALANALMKAETKSKRRVTLSIVGLGILDETELETVRGARLVSVNTETGEIIEASPTPAATPSDASGGNPRQPDGTGRADPAAAAPALTAQEEWAAAWLHRVMEFPEKTLGKAERAAAVNAAIKHLTENGVPKLPALFRYLAEQVVEVPEGAKVGDVMPSQVLSALAGANAAELHQLTLLAKEV